MNSATNKINVDDLQLQAVKGSGKEEKLGYSYELVDHLNEEICSLKNECARLYSLIREKDVELRRIKKFNDQVDLAGASDVSNETVAVKIVELSKKVRELTAEVESERAKSKRALNKIREMESVKEPIPPVPSAPSDEEKLLADLKSANDRARTAEGRIVDMRNQLEEARREARMATRVLVQEVGDGVDIHNLLRNDGGSTGWKGRAQQIHLLQKKVSDLKASLSSDGAAGRQPSEASNLSINEEPLSSRHSTANSRHVEALRRFEKERRVENDRLLSEKQVLQHELDETKQTASAAKARNKTLQGEVKGLKDRIEQLLEKSRNDDEFVKMLLKQQETLRQTVTAPSQQEKIRKDNSMQSEKESSRVAELQAKITALQKELNEKSQTSDVGRIASSSQRLSPPTNDYDVLELRSLLEASNLECTKLTETVRSLHEQMDKLTHDKMALGSEIASYRREQAVLEKQIGKLKLDLDKATGRGGETAQRHRNEVFLSESEDLRVKVDVLTEERAAYRQALEKSSEQRKQELLLFEQLMDETKRIFSQSVRQMAKRVAENSDSNTN